MAACSEDCGVDKPTSNDKSGASEAVSEAVPTIASQECRGTSQGSTERPALPGGEAGPVEAENVTVANVLEDLKFLHECGVQVL